MKAGYPIVVLNILCLIGALYAPPSWTVKRLEKELKETKKYLQENTGASESVTGQGDKSNGKADGKDSKKDKTALANRFMPTTNERIGKPPVKRVEQTDSDGDGRPDAIDYYPSNPDFKDRISLEVQSVHRGYGGSSAKKSANVKIKGGGQFYVKVGDKIPKAGYTGKNKQPCAQVIAIDAGKRTVTIVDIRNGKKRMSTKRSYRQEAD